MTRDFNAKYPSIVQALAAMPDETVIDGRKEKGRKVERLLLEHQERPVNAHLGAPETVVEYLRGYRSPRANERQ